MIDKNKLREFLTNRHAEASKICGNSAGAEYYYQLGQANATAKIITKLNSGEFDVKETLKEEFMQWAIMEILKS